MSLFAKLEYIKEQTSSETVCFSTEDLSQLMNLAPSELMKKVQNFQVLTKGTNPTDSFDKKKELISAIIKGLRSAITSRNAQEDLTERAVQSSQIRKKIRQLTTEITKLDEEVTKSLKKLEKKRTSKKNREKLEELRTRSKIVKLMFAHLAEVTQYERRLPGNNVFDEDEPTINPIVTEIPQIDGPLGQIMRLNEQKIDQFLDLLEQGVQVSKEIALSLQRETDRQGEVFIEMNVSVDGVNTKLEDETEQLSDVSKETGKPGKFCLNVIISLLSLGLIGILVSFFL